MGFVESLLVFIGFGIGLPIGLFIGFFVFIYFVSNDVKDFAAKPVDELDSSVLVDLFPKLPLWVMNPDYERVEWLNKFITDMWPYFDKAASGLIKSSIEPMFADYVARYCIKSIAFDCVTLGDLPPKIYGVKTHESKENELVIDLALRWAGNSNITLSINILSLQLSVQLVDLQVSASIRILLRPLVPTFPCFSSIAVSLMEKPQIDFGLKLIGADFMAVPGLYQLMQETVNRQVAKLYHWPQTYDLDILDSSIGATKKPVGILHVKIIGARQLLNMDFLGTSDPYVKLSLSGERLPAKKTSVKMNNLNPDWYEDFKLKVKDPEAQVLQLQLYDWEKVGAHDYLGMQVVRLNQLMAYDKKLFTLNLLHSTDPTDLHNKKARGKIKFEMTFVPFFDDSKKFNNGSLDYRGNGTSQSGHAITSLRGTGLLLITIIGAEDVEGKNPTNPFVKILFRGEQRKTKANRSIEAHRDGEYLQGLMALCKNLQTIKKTRHPYWNEEFEFVLEAAPIQELIHIGVMSKRRRFGIASKESLGHVDINLADVVYNGHINEKYHLINSRHGILHLDMRWNVI